MPYFTASTAISQIEFRSLVLYFNHGVAITDALMMKSWATKAAVFLRSKESSCNTTDIEME
jgi:hypothetical protein